MDKIILATIALLFSNICVAQIGINTENPQAIFHIDGASTLVTTNPLTGTVTPDQATDDVVITTSGNVGIGTITPVTRVDIKSSTPGAIRIVDSTEGEGKVLTSNANGVASWASMSITGGASSTTWFALLDGDWGPDIFQNTYTVRQIGNYNKENVMSDPSKGSIDPTSGVITVPYTGKYRISLVGRFMSNRVGNFAKGQPYRISPVVLKNGVSMAVGSRIGFTDSWAITTTFEALLDFVAGDQVAIATDETQIYSANNCMKLTFFLEFLYSK